MGFPSHVMPVNVKVDGMHLNAPQVQTAWLALQPGLCSEPDLARALPVQDDKYERAEELTEEAKRAVRVAHAEAEEAARKRAEAEAAEKAAQEEREKARADAERLQLLRAQVGPS